VLNHSNEIQYKLDASGKFIIKNYNSAKLFSSFFPGVAGKEGIPMWLFYVNRGQCVCSMGIQDKEHPIMEFLPANRAYQLASSQGFRTFIKLNDNESTKFYEPFQNHLESIEHDKSQTMIIAPYGLTIEEENHTLGLKFKVEYFNIAQDKFPGLVRKLSIENLNNESVNIDGLDGLPLIIPYGIDNGSLKMIRRLVEAFVEVSNYDTGVPFFRGKVEPSDRPEVVRIKKGNFYVGFENSGSKTKLIAPIVDPVKIFGSQSDYSYPERFLTCSAEELYEGQILENRLPSAMGYFKTEIPSGGTYTYTSIIGHSSSIEELNSLIPIITKNEYIDLKSNTNRELIQTLTQNNFICSQIPVFDRYTRLNFLDNTLRGGFPHTLKGTDSKFALHLFSRKHGDLERDYNDYQLMPTNYSQGNGNFRDVNQNRRNDLLFNPDVKENNVEQFYNLIQLDGFNPLVIKETRFSVSNNESIKPLLGKYFDKYDTEGLFTFLQSPFTPGEITTFFKENKISINGSTESFIADLVKICEKFHDTDYGEGFWSDHWTYNLDLLENYLAVYPEKLSYLLFEKRSFSFYDNPHRVHPREDKYVIWEGKAMQLGSVVFDEKKDKLISERKINKNRVHTDFGKGEVYSTNLLTTFLSLIVNKMASLDPEGVGVELETDKPNWYDALNGLPGILGSSLNETLEIKRHILFLMGSFEVLSMNNESWAVYEELIDFMNTLQELLNSELSPFEFWDKASTAKESYREKTIFGVSGQEKNITISEIKVFFEACLKKLDAGIDKAWNTEEKVISTYFINEVVDYQLIMSNESEIKCNSKGLQCFKAKKFKQIHLPLFLEGPVHYMRCHKNNGNLLSLATSIRKSGLYDKKLKMYKVNASLEDQPMEIGRARTFSPGWFENESIWLHMEYKYMLELLRSGLYDQFYQDFKNVFVPFFDPEVYGRSILENSSFIVTSCNPDTSIHGNGFVARLSGATAEFIHILFLMMIGEKPFSINLEGNLQLKFSPALAGWFFTKEVRKKRLKINDNWQEVEFAENTFSFMFLGSILVTYHNPKMLDTFGKDGATPSKVTVIDNDGVSHEFADGIVTGEITHKIRDRKVNNIKIELA
jgi:hypothetical protein